MRTRALRRCLAVVSLSGCSPEFDAQLESGGDPPPTARPVASEPHVLASSEPNKIATVNVGEAYKAECIAQGVPVPETVLDLENGWHITDPPIAHPFLRPDLELAQLWTFAPTSGGTLPEGMCMALPRGHVGSQAEIVGVICMGSNGKTCFFTNDAGDTFDPTQPIEIGELIGGADLVGAAEGECSDCHAGENPFVVHPDDPAFIEAKANLGNLFPDVWPTPIVPAEFPGNPPPIQQLGPVGAGEARCDLCHTTGIAGRFPLVSTDYPGYCSSVLALAVGEDEDIPNTMPPSALDLDITEFADHRDWLLAACQSAPGEGQVIPFDVPHFEVFPPRILPPYTCAKQVTVTNAVMDATIELYNDRGVVIASGVMRTPSTGHVFTLATALVEGQVIRATQTVNGEESAPVSATVRAYDGHLPPPVLPSPLYECATAIAVLNVPGVELEVRVTKPMQSTTTHKQSTGVDRTWVGGLPQFSVGTDVKVRQRLCSDNVSDFSEIVDVQEAPDSLPDVTIESPLVAGQLVDLASIVQGSRVIVKEQSSGIIVKNTSSVPFQRWENIDVETPLGEPLDPTHILVPRQQLCGVLSDFVELPPPLPCDADALLVEIARPTDGDDFVLVVQGIPGGVVRVFDATSEIGNGSGNVIGLTRELVSGEVLAVVQELGTCSADQAFSISVL